MNLSTKGLGLTTFFSGKYGPSIANHLRFNEGEHDVGSSIYMGHHFHHGTSEWRDSRTGRFRRCGCRCCKLASCLEIRSYTIRNPGGFLKEILRGQTEVVLGYAWMEIGCKGHRSVGFRLHPSEYDQQVGLPWEVNLKDARSLVPAVLAQSERQGGQLIITRVWTGIATS